MSSTKRQRRGGGGGGGRKKGGDGVEAVRKREDTAARDRNLDHRNRAREVSQLLHNERQLREEIDKLTAEEGDADSQQIKLLQGALAKHQSDAQKRLAKQELDSELARKRKLASGRGAGPAPPPTDPPRRGPGFSPPEMLEVRPAPSPPPIDEWLPPPLPPPPPMIPLFAAPPSPPQAEDRKPASTSLFMPSSVKRR
ncbi:hypothetical protein BASA81_014002 [Batrachochytrium salamandrivorans]|nr:hypothetical protein BASA81_014002 [Batrachochytrium salamandrivorans]